jgi:hypothetical protein
MDVSVIIVEQLDPDDSLRTFRMQAEYGDRITVALANEYDEPRSGPFHFLDEHHEASFARAFAECKVRKLAANRFRVNDERYSFRTSWAGIPTERQRLSYYALCLPEYAVPSNIRFTDPRSGREYKKSVVRDDHRRRYVLYLECRSSYGSFDFTLETDFRILPRQFHESEFTDPTTIPYGAHTDAYEYLLDRKQQQVVHQFFSETLTCQCHIRITSHRPLFF